MFRSKWRVKEGGSDICVWLWWKEKKFTMAAESRSVSSRFNYHFTCSRVPSLAYLEFADFKKPGAFAPGFSQWYRSKQPPKCNSTQNIHRGRHLLKRDWTKSDASILYWVSTPAESRMYTVPQYSVQVVALCCFCAQVAGTTFRLDVLGYQPYKSFRDAPSYLSNDACGQTLPERVNKCTVRCCH